MKWVKSSQARFFLVSFLANRTIGLDFPIVEVSRRLALYNVGKCIGVFALCPVIRLAWINDRGVEMAVLIHHCPLQRDVMNGADA